jgi:hypothetical protein
MNTTSTDITSFSECNNTWQSFVILGLNILGIAISLGKQLLNINNKKHINIVDSLNSLLKSPQEALQTEAIQLEIPEHLKGSVQGTTEAKDKP